MFLSGTSIPAFLAASNPTMTAPETEVSASRAVGEYLQPPKEFWSCDVIAHRTAKHGPGYFTSVCDPATHRIPRDLLTGAGGNGAQTPSEARPQKVNFDTNTFLMMYR